MRHLLAFLAALLLLSPAALADSGKKGGGGADILITGSDGDSTTTSSASGLELVGGKLTLLRGCSDEQPLPHWDEATDVWMCAADATGAGGSAIIFDIDDDSGNDNTDTNEIATMGDTNGIFTAPGGEKILILVDNNWPIADLADEASALEDGTYGVLSASGGDFAIVDGSVVGADLADQTIGDITIASGSVAVIDLECAVAGCADNDDVANALDIVGGSVANSQIVLEPDDGDVTQGAIQWDNTSEEINIGNGASQVIVSTGAHTSEEQIEDFVGGMLVGIETGITVGYDDPNGEIDFAVSVTNAQVADTLTIDSSSTITDATVTLKDGTAPTPTTDGEIWWESDAKRIVMGDGVDQQFIVPTESVFGDATMDTAGEVTIADDAVELTAQTAGNYVASITNGTGITGGDGGSEGAALTLAASLGTDIVTGEIVNDTILEEDLDATNTPTDEYIATFEGGAGGDFEWEPAVDNTAGATIAGAGLTTPDNETINLDTSEVSAISSDTAPTSTANALVIDTNGDTGGGDTITHDVLTFSDGTSSFLLIPVREYPTDDGQILKYNETNNDIGWGDDSTGSEPTFDTVSAGTNTGEALVVGNTSTLSASGTGTITATGVDAVGAAAITIGSADVTEITIQSDGATVTEADLAIIADSTITLTTETTGNYAAGDDEAGAALTGDSATEFFSAGTIEHEWGGLELDVNAYDGIVAITGGSTVAAPGIDAKSELESHLDDVTDLALADGDVFTGVHDFGGATSLEVPNSAGAAPTASGLIAYDSTANQLEYGDNTVNRVVVNLDEDQILTNKTLTTPTISGTWNMASAAVTLPTDQTLTTPTIADLTNAAHDHADAAGGGALGAGAIDDVTDIAADHLTGSDTTLVTGTFTTAVCAEWNADGDIVAAASAAACGSGGGGSSEWTDTGTVVHPTETGDDVALGNTTLVNSSKLSIDGDADQVQFTVQGNATQTNNLIVAEQSDGTEVATLDNAGALTVTSLDTGVSETPTIAMEAGPTNDDLDRDFAITISDDASNNTITRFINEAGGSESDWMVLSGATNTITIGNATDVSAIVLSSSDPGNDAVQMPVGAVDAAEIKDDTVAFADMDHSATVAGDLGMAANQVHPVAAGLAFEGTADAIEGVIAWDPDTADETVTIPAVTETDTFVMLSLLQTLDSKTLTTPIITGKVDRNNVAVNDDDCTGEQGDWWYDTTDSAFEFCNANSGAPATLAATSGDITTVGDCTTGDCFDGTAGTALTMGTGTVASTGSIRMANNSTTGGSVLWRNAGDTDDVGWYVNSADEMVLLGGTFDDLNLNTTVTLDANTTTAEAVASFVDVDGSEDNVIFASNVGASTWTLTAVRCIAQGTTPSTVVTINVCDSDGVTGCSAHDAAALTCDGGLDEDTSLDGDTTWAAGETLHVDFGTTSGTIDSLWIGVEYTRPVVD